MASYELTKSDMFGKWLDSHLALHADAPSDKQTSKQHEIMRTLSCASLILPDLRSQEWCSFGFYEKKFDDPGLAGAFTEALDILGPLALSVDVVLLKSPFKSRVRQQVQIELGREPTPTEWRDREQLCRAGIVHSLIAVMVSDPLLALSEPDAVVGLAVETAIPLLVKRLSFLISLKERLECMTDVECKALIRESLEYLLTRGVNASAIDPPSLSDYRHRAYLVIKGAESMDLDLESFLGRLAITMSAKAPPPKDDYGRVMNGTWLDLPEAENFRRHWINSCEDPKILEKVDARSAKAVSGEWLRQHRPDLTIDDMKAQGREILYLEAGKHLARHFVLQTEPYVNAHGEEMSPFSYLSRHLNKLYDFAKRPAGSRLDDEDVLSERDEGYDGVDAVSWICSEILNLLSTDEEVKNLSSGLSSESGEESVQMAASWLRHVWPSWLRLALTSGESLDQLAEGDWILECFNDLKAENPELAPVASRMVQSAVASFGRTKR